MGPHGRPRAPLCLLLLLDLLVVALVRGDSPPAVRRSQPVLLLNVTLADVTPKQFLDAFWHDAGFYADFLKKTGDIEVDVPKAWQPSAAAKGSLERTVVTKHPVATRVPGMGIPSHVKSTKKQTLTHETVSPTVSHLPVLRVVEKNVVEGVPFADRFYVTVDWRARWLPPPPSHSSHHHRQRHHRHRSLCRLEVFLHVVFTGRFLLESVVARNAASETAETLKVWERGALEKFPRAPEGGSDEEDVVASVEDGSSACNEPQGLLSRLRNGFKEPRSLGVLLTALCTSVVLLLTGGKLPGAFGSAGGAVPGGIH